MRRRPARPRVYGDRVPVREPPPHSFTDSAIMSTKDLNFIGYLPIGYSNPKVHVLHSNSEDDPDYDSDYDSDDNAEDMSVALGLGTSRSQGTLMKRELTSMTICVPWRVANENFKLVAYKHHGIHIMKHYEV